MITGRGVVCRVLLFLVVALSLSFPLSAVGSSEGAVAGGRPAERGEAAQLPAGVSTDWWAGVQQGLAATEYEAAWQKAVPELLEGKNWSAADGCHQAPNRAQNLRTYFGADGVRLVRRTEAEPSWWWGLTLERIGLGEDLQAVAGAKPEVSGNRVEYRRGEVVEWYLNSGRGLEQGFTVAAAPGTSDGPLVLEFGLAGTLSPALSDDGQTLDLSTPDGVQALRYAGLSASDATGKKLDAWMQLVAGNSAEAARLWLVVDAEGATYPVAIDPLATSPSWIAESNQSGATFGYSVAGAGDVNGDGYADVIVGAPFYDNGETDEGRAFVYYGSASGLAASPAWTAEANQVDANFGRSVAGAGDVNSDGYDDVILGAPYFDNGEADEGRAFVYHGSASGLSASPAWTAESNQASAYFGQSVAGAGDVNDDGYADVIIGASSYDNGETDEGRAFVYHGSASGLSASPAWTAESDQQYGYFGWSVASAGDVNGDGYSDVIEGAPYYSNTYSGEGRASVYHGSAAGLAASPAWTAEGNQAGAYFGCSVAGAGDVNGDGYADVIIGANVYDNGQTDEGRAYVYSGSASGLSVSPAWTAESNQDGAWFGWSVAGAGDIDGDGYADVIVGAPSYDNGQTDEGRAYVYSGSASGLSASPTWTAEGDQDSASFGTVAGAGDVNGDGYADVIVGAFYYDNGQTDEGRAFVYEGSASPEVPLDSSAGLLALVLSFSCLLFWGLARRSQ